MTFPTLNKLAPLQAAVARRKEIRVTTHDCGATTLCYAFQDRETFDVPEALECRGVAFDRDGRICSRPLHKFFNVGEREWTLPERLARRGDLHQVQEKLDGSMIATAWVDGRLLWRSRKSFTSDVVTLTQGVLKAEPNLTAFATEVAAAGYTATFELTHPQARIVVAHQEPALRLLHVRENVTGNYVMLDRDHWVWELIDRHEVPRVHRHVFLELSDALTTLENMEQREGYVFQFSDGDMVKAKCPWYLRLHRCVSLLRERDIARLALHEDLDDTRSALAEIQVDMAGVDAVAARVKADLVAAMDEVDGLHAADGAMPRKDFAIKYKGHELFSLLMQRYSDREPDYIRWYERNHLRQKYGLDVLASGALAEAVEG